MNEINPYISNEKYNVYHFKDRKELALKILEIIQKEEKELTNLMDA
jgi:hypothetical protein